ncbi:MAG: proteasome subunit beta [Acidimicrobiia bacterium]|nr:MAG: proteasome subunit beta [Acidimicrobiia bacterium]
MIDDLRALSGPAAGGFTELLTSLGHTPAAPEGGIAGDVLAPEATTVLAIRHDHGVVMIGDRQATEGYSVANRRMRKVFPADEHAAVAISGTAGLAVDMVRLFQTELEHYEKLEGSRLSLEGKANYLSRMVRGALPMAMQGLVVVPLFAGFDLVDGTGRLFTFDVVGGRYEETAFGATGSGSREAKSYLRAAYAPGLDATGTVDLGLQALVAAAEQDVATSGPDFERGIMPVVVMIDADGYRELDDEVVSEAARRARDEVVR